MKKIINNKLQSIKKQLAPFLKQNTCSKISAHNKVYYITEPWGDKSVSLALEKKTASDLIKALNNVILPARFTALYHIDSNTMEFIYTILPKNDPIIPRNFDFILNGKTYPCKFSRASDRLLSICKHFEPTRTPSDTDHRNLMILNTYLDRDNFKLKVFENYEPISFFIEGFNSFDEGFMMKFTKHLNFFMSYYDRRTPRILTHPKSTETPLTKQVQYLNNAFPKKISTSEKNSFVLDLITVARNVTEQRLKFLYYFQILEYAAFYYVENETKCKLLRVINTPDIHSDPEKCIIKLLDICTESRQDDSAKLSKVVQAACSPDIAWKEIHHNISYFSKKQEFDGGFTIDPFVCDTMTLENFESMWIPKAPVTLNKIRNGLVHGRESRQEQVIAPTEENDIKIKPWVYLIRRIAEQVLIFLSL